MEISFSLILISVTTKNGYIGDIFVLGGWNSTLESICEGVPMICLPCFTDQMVNLRYVSHVWRAGVRFETGLSREKFETILEESQR
ncbi:hypothetical protein ACS0TY_033788 [Phlomoides rotata]